MTQHRTHLLILLCFLLLLGGCKQKKTKHLTHDEPVPTVQQTPVAPLTPDAPVLPPEQVIPDEPLTPQQEQPAVQTVPEQPEQPAVNTLNIQKMTFTVYDHGHKFSTPGSIRWERGVGAILSIQPLAGIELMRAEATPQRLTIINKLTHSYAQASAEAIREKYAISLSEVLDAAIDAEIIRHLDEPVIRLSQTQAQTTVELVIYPQYVRINEKVNIQSSNIQGYRHVSAEQLLQTLL